MQKILLLLFLFFFSETSIIFQRSYFTSRKWNADFGIHSQTDYETIVLRNDGKIYDSTNSTIYGNGNWSFYESQQWLEISTSSFWCKYRTIISQYTPAKNTIALLGNCKSTDKYYFGALI